MLYCSLGAVIYTSNSQLVVRLEICQKIHMTEFLGQKFYTLKVCKLQLFLLKKKQRKCINISYLIDFFLKFNWVCKILTVSVQNHTWCVYILQFYINYARNRVTFRKNLHSWHKFYTIAGRGGGDKSQLCLLLEFHWVCKTLTVSVQNHTWCL